MMDSKRRASPKLYWRLFSLSPWIMLIGMVAGGWLIIRSIFVWGVEEVDYAFGVDIPISAAILAVWAAVAVVLLFPPETVLAKPLSTVAAERVLVWPRGRTHHAWNFVAVPIGGLLGAMASFAIPTALGWNPDVPADLWIGLPLAVGLTALAVALIWSVLRSAFYGVELTSTYLIARGLFISRRYTRQSIVSVRASKPKGWLHVVAKIFLKIDPDRALRLSLKDGTSVDVPASSPHVSDAEHAADMVRAWRSALD